MPPEPIGPGGIPANPKKRDKRIMWAIAAGGLLAIFFLIRSRGQAAAAQTAAPTTTAAQDSSLAPTAPSTFADNGAQAASQADQISTALGSQSDQISQALAAQSQAISSALTAQTSGTDTSGPQSVAAQDIGAEAGLITALATALRPATTAAAPQGKTGPRGKPGKPGKPGRPGKTAPRPRGHASAGNRTVPKPSRNSRRW